MTRGSRQEIAAAFSVVSSQFSVLSLGSVSALVN
jgi:hypothetical protein